jgi:hypothetical protein
MTFAHETPDRGVVEPNPDDNFAFVSLFPGNTSTTYAFSFYHLRFVCF